MNKTHNYKSKIVWTGNLGNGTSDYTSYERSHTINVENKIPIEGSSDPAFRGDSHKHNPEDLFLSSLSSCHMLWYLHLCANAGVIILNYIDYAEGTMEETPDGGGHFTNVTLNPHVVVSSQSMIEKALNLHHDANKFCFIANSCNFKIDHKPVITTHNA